MDYATEQWHLIIIAYTNVFYVNHNDAIFTSLDIMQKGECIKILYIRIFLFKISLSKCLTDGRERIKYFLINKMSTCVCVNVYEI